MPASVPQNALVLDVFVAMLQNELGAVADGFSWKKHDGEYDDLNGLAVIEQVDPRYNVTHTTGGVADLSGGVQKTVFGGEVFKVNDTFGVSMGVGDFEKIRDLGAARESRALKSAVTNMAEKITSYLLRTAALASYSWTGTPGQVVDDVDEFVTAYTRLKEQGVSDSDLRSYMSFSDKQKLGDQILNLPAPDDEVTKVLRKGFKGSIWDIPVAFTQQLPTFTNGTDVTGVEVNGASENKNYTDVSKSGSINGRYKTQVLKLKGVTDVTGTIKQGAVFTIENVYAYDNRAQKTLDYLQEFTVVADAVGVSGNLAEVIIYPAIIVPGTGAGVEADVNTAHATVGSIPADSADVVFKGEAGTTYTPRLMLQKDSMEVSCMDLILPYTGQRERRKLPFLPASVRLWKHSVFDTPTGAAHHKARFDIALTANIRQRDGIVRFNGS